MTEFSYSRILRSNILMLAILLLPSFSFSQTSSIAQRLGLNNDGHGLSAARSSTGTASLSAQNSSNKQLLYLEQKEASWNREIVDRSLNQLGDTSLVFKGSVPHILYQDRVRAQLKHAYKSGQKWIIEIVPAAKTSNGEVSATVCGTDICAAYYQASDKSIYLARRSGKTWRTTKIDGNGRDVGLMNGITSTARGTVVVSYFDNTEKRVRVAEQSNGSWSIESVGYLQTAVGSSPRIAASPDGTLHLVFSRYRKPNNKNELALYYGKKEPGGKFETSVVSNDYLGGESDILLLRDYYPVISSAYHRHSKSHGNSSGILLSALTPSGVWQQSLYAPDSRNLTSYYRMSDPEVLLDKTDKLQVIYHFNPESAPNLPLKEGIMVHQHDAAKILNLIDLSLSYRLGLDTDNDGLLDIDEYLLGTDFRNRDTDHDGISDGDEIIAGTNPLDRGSRIEDLDKELCAEWNGFLPGIWNVFEHVNMSNSKFEAKTKLYQMNGKSGEDFNFSISRASQFDLLVHGLPSWKSRSYGKVCTSHSGYRGDLDGRMVYYKPGANSSFEFALGMQVSSGKIGEQFVSFNTFHPSLNPHELTLLAANWLQITNPSSKAVSGTIAAFDHLGNKLGSWQLTIEASSRYDFALHELGQNLLGLASWTPDNPEQALQMRNVRYIYNNADLAPSFDGAVQLEGRYGSGDTVSAVVDTTANQSSILELSNTLDATVDVKVELYDESGDTRPTKKLSLSGKSSIHLLLEKEFGAEKRGVVIVSANEPSSIIANVMQYFRAIDGSLNYVYTVPATHAFGHVMRGSYNTYLDQQSTLAMVNPTNKTTFASISLSQASGSPLASDITTKTHTIPPHGRLDLHLLDSVGKDSYGIVTVQTDTAGSLNPILFRYRQGDYVLPTVLR